MPDKLRIAVDDLRKRMEAGEDFVLIDTRNPQAWAQSDVKLPEAIRVPLDNLALRENLEKWPIGADSSFRPLRRCRTLEPSAFEWHSDGGLTPNLRTRRRRLGRVGFGLGASTR